MWVQGEDRFISCKILLEYGIHVLPIKTTWRVTRLAIPIREYASWLRGVVACNL